MSVESELKRLFESIFNVPVTFDLQSSAQEQMKLFVEIDSPQIKISSGVQHAVLTGSATLYAPSEQAKIGFLTHAIEVARPELTKDLFFEEVDGNSRQYRDIVGRGFRFTYFFRSQFNPPGGTIESVDFKE